MKTSAGNLKKGDFISYQDGTWQVQKAEFYSPGKGSALMRAKIKNVSTGKNIDYAFKSNEDVETLDVQSLEMQYLYKDAELAYFMDERTYIQYDAPLSVMGDIIQYFKEGEKMYVFVQNEKILSVRPPMSVKLKIVETEDAAKGDTVTNARKPATVETGATVMVPLFCKAGDVITINPETTEYTGRE